MKRFVVKKTCKVFLITVLLLLNATSFSQDYKILNWTEIPIDTSHWNFEFPISIEINSGEKMVTTTGKAFSKQIEGIDYSIEMQVKGTGWPCLLFHMLDFNNHEKVYFRPSDSGTSYAIQYVPVYKGFTPWRIYGNEQAKAMYNKEWNTYRVDVVDNKGYVFVNNEDAPSFKINKLRNSTSNRCIGFGSMFGTMSIKYIKYAPIKSVDNNSARNDSSAILNWEISQTYSLFDSTLTIGKALESFKYPAKELQARLEWETVRTDYDGILNITKYRNNTDKKGNTNFIVAKTNIVSDKKKTVTLQFGFCDIAAVYVNGKYVFSGYVPLIDKEAYIRGSMNNKFEINLLAGNNELLVVTSGYDNEGSDGGWGILAKITCR